jgi:hypothetical protein
MGEIMNDGWEDEGTLSGPPEGGVGRGEPLTELLDLARVAPGAPPQIVDFYRHPDRYAIRVVASSDRWGRYALSVFAAAFRQCCVPMKAGCSYQVCQRLYLDDRHRPHWDRYVRVDGVLRRLFVARVEGREGRVDETFDLWGVPARLAFDVRVHGAAVVLTLDPAKSSPLAWPLRVQYRTAVAERGVLHTEGDFRVPLAGIRVRTHFTIARLPAA